MKDKFDTIVVGAGIAGLGVAAILAKEAHHKVLVLDRYPSFGGRLLSYGGAPQKEWRVDVGLHMIELGEKSSATELNTRVGKTVNWGPFSKTVEIWNGKKFINVAELVPMSDEDKIAFRELLQQIAALSDQEIEQWDNRSWEEWLVEHVPQPSVRELFIDFGMIMTTIPLAIDMAAGEVLYIARENLIKHQQVLSASYPLDGMEGLTRGLVETIEENGGTLKFGCNVQEIIFENRKAIGARIPSGNHIYPMDYRMPDSEIVYADRVVCALPIYQLSNIIDFNPATSPMPMWWLKRVTDIQHEITGLIGYVIGLSEPVVDPQKLCFLSALKTKKTGLPFQGFPASNFSPDVAPEGKQVLHTDIVCEHAEASDKFERNRLLNLMWEDIQEMFPGIDNKVEWKIPYFVDGCDGLARKPGLVGNFKPALTAPGISNLFFAGDTYIGRGLAANGAARSAMHCADIILKA
ncbi:MAG: FAD-dependent oxidoreductase [Thermodesulfobacteriota bacterium]